MTAAGAAAGAASVQGAQALTDAELVAILIRVGFKGTSAVELGRDL